MSTPEMDHVEWPCDNYTEPVTCLTARATETGQCRVCRIRAVDRLLAALYGADLRERVEALADDWDRHRATFPPTREGNVSAATLRLCTQEMRAAIADVTSPPGQQP